MPSMVGVGLIAVGVIVILLGIRKKKRYSGRTVGKIIGVRESQETDDDGRTSYHYYPQFEYVVNGETYRGEGSTSYSKPQKFQHRAARNTGQSHRPGIPGQRPEQVLTAPGRP